MYRVGRKGNCGGCDKAGALTHLVTESVSTDADRLDPSWDGFWDLLKDNRFTEDGTAEDVSDLESARNSPLLPCSRKTLTVPLGDLHISFRLNSLTRASSGVIVAHLTPTEYFLIASAESIVI